MSIRWSPEEQRGRQEAGPTPWPSRSESPWELPMPMLEFAATVFSLQLAFNVRTRWSTKTANNTSKSSDLPGMITQGFPETGNQWTIDDSDKELRDETRTASHTFDSKLCVSASLERFLYPRREAMRNTCLSDYQPITSLKVWTLKVGPTWAIGA